MLAAAPRQAAEHRAGLSSMSLFGNKAPVSAAAGMLLRRALELAHGGGAASAAARIFRGSHNGVSCHPVCVPARGVSAAASRASTQVLSSLPQSGQHPTAAAQARPNTRRDGGGGKRGYGGGRGINDFWDPNTMYYIIGANVLVFVLWQNHNLRRFMVEHFALSTAGVLKDLRIHTIFTSIVSTPNFGMCLGNCVTLWFFGAECLGDSPLPQQCFADEEVGRKEKEGEGEGERDEENRSETRAP